MIEYVPRHACPAPPLTNEARWKAREALYRALRNTEATNDAPLSDSEREELLSNRPEYSA